MFGAVSAHGWLTWTDVWGYKVLPFASHMWEVHNGPITYRWVYSCMQHLMPHWILRMCVYITASKGTEANATENNLTGYKHLILVRKELPAYASLWLTCILNVLWPWAFAVCSHLPAEYKHRWFSKIKMCTNVPNVSNEQRQQLLCNPTLFEAFIENSV